MTAQFQPIVKNKKELLEVMGMCYAGMIRHGMTHDEFVADVKKLPFSNDKEVDLRLEWLKDNMIAVTKSGARTWSKLSNKSLSYEDKLDATCAYRIHKHS